MSVLIAGCYLYRVGYQADALAKWVAERTSIQVCISQNSLIVQSPICSLLWPDNNYAAAKLYNANIMGRSSNCGASVCLLEKREFVHHLQQPELGLLGHSEQLNSTTQYIILLIIYS